MILLQANVQTQFKLHVHLNHNDKAKLGTLKIYFYNCFNDFESTKYIKYCPTELLADQVSFRLASYSPCRSAVCSVTLRRKTALQGHKLELVLFWP